MRRAKMLLQEFVSQRVHAEKAGRGKKDAFVRFYLLFFKRCHQASPRLIAGKHRRRIVPVERRREAEREQRRGSDHQFYDRGTRRQPFENGIKRSDGGEYDEKLKR